MNNLKQSVTINKINWKKINDSLATNRIHNNELQILSRVFDSVLEAHTDLSDTIFLRQYIFSVLVRLHTYLKELNLIQNPKALKDMYDYILSTMIMAMELSYNHSLDSGISYFITRIMNKLFDVESTNSALVILNEKYRLKQKYVLEPIIANTEDKLSLDKAKEFIDFICNTFSYVENSNRFVSISVFCSSLWLNRFDKLPYLVDDYIIPDFSSNPENVRILNSLLLSRREYILASFKENNGEMSNLGEYSYEEYIKAEPDELYKDIQEFEDRLRSEESECNRSVIGIDVEEPEVMEYDLGNIAEEGKLPEFMESEIKVYDQYLTDLNCAVNGTIARSDVSPEEVAGNVSDIQYPRIRQIFQLSMNEDIEMKDVLESLWTYDREIKISEKKSRKKKNSRVSALNKVLEKIDEVQESIKDKKAEISGLNNKYLEDFLSTSKIFNSEDQVYKFQKYFEDISKIMSENDKVLNKETVVKIIDGYNTSVSKKIRFKNIKENKDGVISLDCLFGDKKFSHFKIENGKFNLQSKEKTSDKKEGKIS